MDNETAWVPPPIPPAPPGEGPVPSVAPSRAAMDRSLVQGIAWMGMVKWTGQLVSWLSTLVVARLLSPTDYGLVGMATTYLGLLTIVSEFGIGTAILTFRSLSAHQIAQINTVSVLLGCAGFLLSCALAVPIAAFYGVPQLVPVIIALSSTFLVSSFRSIPWALLRRDMRFKRVAVFEGVQTIALAMAAMALAASGFGYWTLVIAAVLSNVFTSAIALTFHRVPFARPRWGDLREALGYSREVIVQRSAWYAYSNADFLVAGRVLGTNALGAYTLGWTLATTPLDKVGNLVLQVTPSVLAAVQDDREALARYVTALTEGLSIILFPLLIGLALTAPDFVPLVLGEQWRTMVPALQLLALYTTFRAVLPLFSQVLLVTKDQRFASKNMIATAVAMPLAFLVGSRWGITGIAVAWIVVHPFFGLQICRRVVDRLGLTLTGFLVRTLWPAISACLGMAIAVLGARALLPAGTSAVTRLAAEMLVGAIVYVGVLLGMHGGRMRELRGFATILRARAA